MAERIIAYISVGERCRCRIFVQRITAGCDELVRGVVLVGGDEECAAEAGTGFGDDAAEMREHRRPIEDRDKPKVLQRLINGVWKNSPPRPSRFRSTHPPRAATPRAPGNLPSVKL